MKTKVFLVITKANWGGAQKYVFELATGLPKEQCDMSVFLGQGNILSEKLKAAGIPVTQIPELGRDIAIYADIVSFFKLLRIFWKERPDVVHLNSSKIGGLGALAARLAGIQKIVFTVHGFAFNEDRPVFQKFIIKILSWLTLFLSTNTICISEGEYKAAKNWPLISKKVSLIHNGIAMPAFKEKTEAIEALAAIIKKPSDFFKNKTIIGTIAELTHNKGLEYGIEALEHLPDALYIIIGGGEDEQNLLRLIREKNLEDKVFLAGFVQNAATYLKAFSFFLLPSLKEGLPYVLLEAGLAEVPVIATNVGDIPEIINGTTGVLIPPKSIKIIEKSLRMMIDRAIDTNLLRKNLFEKVTRSFTMDTMLRETFKIYTKPKYPPIRY